jgi:hypothetical protein
MNDSETATSDPKAIRATVRVHFRYLPGEEDAVKRVYSRLIDVTDVGVVSQVEVEGPMP